MEKVESAPTPGGLGDLRTNLLAGTTHQASDLNLIRRAVRERWSIPAEKRPAVVKRLLNICAAEETTVEGAEGPYQSFDAADKNAIQAARVLVAMEGQNQSEEHHAVDVAAGRGRGTTNILVQYGNGVDLGGGQNGNDLRPQAAPGPAQDHRLPGAVPGGALRAPLRQDDAGDD